MEGVPRSGGVVRECKKAFPLCPQIRCPTHLCHCEPSQMAWQSLFCCCVARALMRPVRILVFVQTALALVFTYSDSLRAQRSNPVNYVVAYATHIAFTGSPRSQCSPAMIKSTTPSSPLWRGAAQRRGGQRMHFPRYAPPRLCHCE